MCELLYRRMIEWINDSDAWLGECGYWLFASSSLGLREYTPRQRPLAYKLTGFTPRQMPSRSTTNKRPTHTFTQPSVRTVAHTSIHPPIHSPTHPFIHQYIHPHTHSHSYPANPPLI